MNSVEPNEIARPRVAEDVEPLWHVRFTTGMVTMTLDELDAAFHHGAINAQTLVAREDESALRPLGVVAGLFQQEQGDPRHSEISGVRPAAYAQNHFPELAAHAPTWTLLDGPPHVEPISPPQAIAEWEKPAQRWLRRARGALSARQWLAHWVAVCTPRERWAFGAMLVVSLASLYAWWPAKSSLPEPDDRAARRAARASQLETSVPAAMAAPREPTSLAVPPAAPSIPAADIESAAALAAPVASDRARRSGAFAEGRKSERASVSRRAARKRRAWKLRTGRD